MQSIVDAENPIEGVNHIMRSIQNQNMSLKDLGRLASMLKSKEAWMERQPQRDAWPGAIRSLSPREQSLGYLYLLDAIMPPTGFNDALHSAATGFVQNCHKEQIQLAPAKFAAFCAKLKDNLLASQHPKQAVPILLAALKKLSPGPAYLTPLHAMVLEACLQTQHYRAALTVLEHVPEFVDPAKTGMTSTAFLLYCYYGALIHIGRKQYQEAQRMLLHALTCPSNVVNAISVAAYKKYLMLSLIQQGKTDPVPKYVPSILSRALKSDCQIYTQLCGTFKEGPQAWNAALNKQQTTSLLQTDGNWGLAQLASDSCVEWSLRHVSDTYCTLPLQSMASRAALPSALEAELLVLGMVDSGQMYAYMDEARGVVEFPEEADHYCSPETAQRLHEQLQQASTISKKLAKLDFEVSTDKAYLTRQMGGREKQKGPGLGTHWEDASELLADQLAFAQPMNNVNANGPGPSGS